MRRYATALLISCALAFAGCGKQPATPVAAPSATGDTAAAAPSSPGGFNSIDVMFLQMMVPHHRQGVELVRLAATRPVRSDVKILAAAIETTQTHEIERMSGWLRAWRQPTTADPNAHAGHGGMPGTSAAEIASLKDASGADFERRFLNMLIAHQDDAIQLARMETGGGVHPEAKALADQIRQSRAGQIRLMLGYLGTN